MELQDWRKEPRKNYSNEFKLRMVELASQPGACVAQIARENGVNDNVIFKWLRLWQNEGRVSRRLPVTTSSDTGVELLPVWDALCYYSDDGLAEADNNAAERALRAVCLGKKNFMFFGSDHGGERGALLYGLIGTCRLNGIDPEAYLRHILSVLPEWPSNRVDELLPWNVVLTNK
ncbi:hypothetical protein ETE54_25855 [Escherichia coli]|nr:hypothetical protein ETE54_25855 [Escherichia coli]